MTIRQNNNDPIVLFRVNDDSPIQIGRLSEKDGKEVCYTNRADGDMLNIYESVVSIQFMTNRKETIFNVVSNLLEKQTPRNIYNGEREDDYLETIDNTDPLILFKLYDFSTIMLGRLRIPNKTKGSKFNMPDYCYLYDENGIITKHYSFGISWVHILNKQEYPLKTKIKIAKCIY